MPLPPPRAQRTGGQLALLYVIEPGVDFQWLGVEDVAREEGHNKAKAVFRLFGRKLKAMGFEDLVPEEIVREGMKAEEITKLIEEDEDIGVLVLGASKDPSGPGPLVSTLAGGRLAGTFPVPITVVPGHLSIEEILALVLGRTWQQSADALAILLPPHTPQAPSWTIRSDLLGAGYPVARKNHEEQSGFVEVLGGTELGMVAFSELFNSRFSIS